jgi:hypothetical protein
MERGFLALSFEGARLFLLLVHHKLRLRQLGCR